MSDVGICNPSPRFGALMSNEAISNRAQHTYLDRMKDSGNKWAKINHCSIKLGVTRNNM